MGVKNARANPPGKMPRAQTSFPTANQNFFINLPKSLPNKPTKTEHQTHLP
jgi:hypothetical protein